MELDRVCKLYCARSKDMWRQRVLQEWVAKVASTMVVLQQLRDDAIGAFVVNDSLRLPRMVKHMMLSEEEVTEQHRTEREKDFVCVCVLYVLMFLWRCS